MLKDFVKMAKPEEEELAKRIEDERSKLFAAQMKIKEAGLPVMVIFEGWGAAGKGPELFLWHGTSFCSFTFYLSLVSK